MSKIITFHSLRGGTGKTSLAVNVGALLAEEGYKTLLIDLDPSSGASCGVLYPDLHDQLANSGLTITRWVQAGVMEHTTSPKLNIKECIRRKAGDVKLLDILPSCFRLAIARAEFEELKLSFNTLLENAISSVKEKYSFILIDTPPTGDPLTKAALRLSDRVIVPSLKGDPQEGPQTPEIQSAFQVSLSKNAVLQQAFEEHHPLITARHVNLVDVAKVLEEYKRVVEEIKTLKKLMESRQK